MTKRGLSDAKWSLAHGVPLVRLWAEYLEMSPSAYAEGFRAALMDAVLRQ
jgi:hypothetical protein